MGNIGAELQQSFHIKYIISTLSLGHLEDTVGSITFLKYITIHVVLSPIIYSLICQKLIPTENVILIGYSVVIFGLSAYSSLLDSDSLFILYPFIELIITKIICPSSSLIGHLSGVIVGYAIRYHLFFWYTNSLFIFTLPLIFYFYLNNYNETHENGLKWFENSLKRKSKKIIST